MANGGGVTFYDAFDSRRNGLSTIRLVLASTVVLWHSFPLTGHDIEPEGLREVVGSFRVDAFFAISGFLVLRAWNRNPDTRFFIRSRALRLLPAFWVNLTITAFVIAPIAAHFAGIDVFDLFRGDHSAWRYVAQNASTWMFFYDIGGTPQNVPFPGCVERIRLDAEVGGCSIRRAVGHWHCGGGEETDIHLNARNSLLDISLSEFSD